MFSVFSFLVALLACVGYARAAIGWQASPFNPPSVPLAVRSPYSSAWLPQSANSGSSLSTTWPQFWNGDTLGWAGFVKVDGIAYTFLGAPAVADTSFKAAAQTSLTWTSTQSTFVMTAGAVQLTVNFLSPIEPDSLVNQSLPFSYLAVYATPTDGKTHSVQIYSDISGEWVSGTDTQLINWNTTAGNVIIHQAQLQNQTLFVDSGDRVQYGASYYSTLATSATTWQIAEDIVVRAQFINNSVLLNSEDTNFRAISDDWPCFAFAHDLGNITSKSDTVVFAVGHARDPAISYVTSGGTMQSRSSLFLGQYPSITNALTTFVSDYPNALARATKFDTDVNSAATAVSVNYSDIVALSMRQTLGAIELTYTPGNTSDVTAFLKEISSSESVSTTDVIYPAWPLFMYTNPAIGKALLEPLLAYQATGQYPNKWAMHDLGPDYPRAPGYPSGNDTRMPVEESGNMLIMALSYTQQSGDQSLISTYYSLLDQWAQYLVANTLEPGNQLSSDAFAGTLTNQTDLAIKGIIAIKAMSEIAGLLGNTTARDSYNSTASSYVQQWQKLATTSDDMHLTLEYGNSSSWGIVYNLYADQLLGTNLVPSSVYEMQTNWYSSVQDTYGIPLDTRNTYVLSNEEIWAAVGMTSSSVRNELINVVHMYFASNLNTFPASEWYYTPTGLAVCNTDKGCTPFRARPVVGGHLALLVTNSSASPNPGATTTGGSSPTSTTTTKSSSAVGVNTRLLPNAVCVAVLAALLPLLF